MEKVNLDEKFAAFDDHWSPKVIGAVDDYEVRLAKLKGEFVWHKHDDEDEMFLVVKGSLDIAFRDRTVNLKEGEMLVVPKGVEHKPSAEDECRVLLLEKSSVVNTGDAGGEQTVAEMERL